MILNNAHDAYLESRVLSAGPIELVRILYQTATNAVRDARHYLEGADVLARSRAICKASQAILELTQSLDFARGGEIADRLAKLYSYILRRLIEANFQQSDAPLAEVLGLLATLSEGWEGIGAEAPSAIEPDTRWTSATLQPENTASESARAWSF